MTLVGPSFVCGALHGASSAGPGTGRPAAAAAGSGSTAPEKSASGTSPPAGETLLAEQHIGSYYLGNFSFMHQVGS